MVNKRALPVSFKRKVIQYIDVLAAPPETLYFQVPVDGHVYDRSPGSYCFTKKKPVQAVWKSLYQFLSAFFA